MALTELERQQRLECINSYWRALMTSDFVLFRSLLAPDAVIHYPGQHSLSRDYKTTDEIVGLYTKLSEFLKDGTFVGEVLDITMGDVYTSIVLRYTIKLPFKTIPGRAIGLFIIKEGKIKEYWLHEWDQVMINRVFRASNLFSPVVRLLRKKSAKTSEGPTSGTAPAAPSRKV